MSQSPLSRTVSCESCSDDIECHTFSTGMAVADVLHCSRCEITAILAWGQLPNHLSHLFCPPPAPWMEFDRHLLPYWREIESHLAPCPCGGTFALLNSPRCPHCRQLLLGDLYQDKPILKELDRYPAIPGPTIPAQRLLR